MCGINIIPQCKSTKDICEQPVYDRQKRSFTVSFVISPCKSLSNHTDLLVDGQFLIFAAVDVLFVVRNITFLNY